MFEFSFTGLLAAILAGVLIYHLFGKRFMGWMTPTEVAVHNRLVALEQHAVQGLHAKLTLMEHRLGIAETALNPPTAAPVTPVALAPAAPPPAAPGAPTA